MSSSINEDELKSAIQEMGDFFLGLNACEEKPYAPIIDNIEKKRNVCIEIVEREELDGKAFIEDISKIFPCMLCKDGNNAPLGFGKLRKFIIFTGKQPPSMTYEDYDLLKKRAYSSSVIERDPESESEHEKVRKKLFDMLRYRFVLGHELGHIFFQKFDKDTKDDEDKKTNEIKADMFSYHLLKSRGPVINRFSSGKIMTENVPKYDVLAGFSNEGLYYREREIDNMINSIVEGFV